MMTTTINRMYELTAAYTLYSIWLYEKAEKKCSGHICGNVFDHCDTRTVIGVFETNLIH